MVSPKDQKRDELLELLWHLDESHALTMSALKEHDGSGDFEQSLKDIAISDYVRIEGDAIALTPKGKEMARDITRSHRLAERLMSDVLGAPDQDVEAAACEFEHVLAAGLVDSICTLLGHPRTCPHGNPIPEGKCCKEARETVQSAVISLPEMEVGTAAKVAFINAKDARLLKLMSMGITPGSEIKLHQKYPALVIELEQSQLALEDAIGEDIKVWRPARRGTKNP
ncbi:MAG: metal-dependent transcriptional regulator [Nitrospinae bacterium]|nr:metal-dependent transcriptional regulator [Nitrospinota bacterium]